MDAYEATKVVFSRVQSLDPENASKIMGLLLIQDHGEKEMIRLAFGPENLLHSLVLKARLDLGVSNNTSSTNTSSTTINTNNNNNNSTINNNNINFSKQNSTTCASRFLPNGVKIPTSLSIPTLVSPSNINSSSPSWSGSMFSEGVSSPSCVMTGTGTGSKSTLNPSTPPFYRNGGGRSGVRGGAEMMDEFQLQEQLSFLNDGCSSSPTTLLRPKSSDMFYQSELLGNGNGVGVDGAGDWGGGIAHRRSYSVSDVNLGSLMDDPANGFGWKPCLYYAKGFCKNGSSCRFVHGESELEGNAFVGSPSKLEMMEQCHELLRSKSMQHHKLMAAMASASPSTSPSFPYSINKGLNLFAHHHQNDSPRAAAAAAALMMGEDMNKFSRSPRGLDSCRADLNPASRQIYLTFPADSTFREEDVSNYFSIYGPVQDVRIPYQQKRMFGFVTFVYPETVKIILAKGNPHFVCDSRVLVKPYKEKGKVPDKFRKHQQQMERGEFSSCGSPTGVDSRDLFDPPIGGRMMYETQSQYMLWRRKLEEQADLQQQALELQTRRLMGLQLLDVKRNHHHRSLSSGAPSIHSPSQSPNSIFHQSLLGSDRSSPDASDEICVSPPPLSEANQALEQAINEVIDREKEGSNGGEDNNINFNYNKPSPCHQDNIFDLPESLEHNLPDSPFASPKRLAGGGGSCEAEVMSISANMNSKGSSFLPPSPAIEMAPFKSCYFQMPRFSPGHGAIGM